MPGMAGRSFAIPRCSVHDAPMQKNDKGEWFCLTCADEWLNDYVTAKSTRSLGGVQLPTGVRDTRKKPTFRDLMPNRRWRRQVLKG